MEAVLTVFPILEVVEYSIRELSEALGAHEAANTEQLAVAVDNLGVWLEPVLTAGAGDAVEVHHTRHVPCGLACGLACGVLTAEATGRLSLPQSSPGPARLTGLAWARTGLQDYLGCPDLSHVRQLGQM